MSNLKLKYATLNVRGIRERSKRRKIFHWLKDQKYDIIYLQETFLTKELENEVKKDWNGLIEHNFSDSVHSRGVSILFKEGFEAKILNIHRCYEGRKLLINALINDDVLTLVNVYAPNKDTLQKEFFRRLTTWIPSHTMNHNLTVLAGDFNCNENSKLVWKCFEKLKMTLNLKDIWDSMNRDRPCFTWINPANPAHQSRLDYMLTSQYLLDYFKMCKVRNAPTPDHKAIEVELRLNRNQRGPSYWKLNTSILKEEAYMQIIKDVILKTKQDYSSVLSNRDLWDFVKIKIKEMSIRYCIDRSKAKNIKHDKMEKRLANLEDMIRLSGDTTKSLKTERQNIIKELDTFHSDRARACQIRSRAKWIEEGEKSTSYFLQLEKQRQTFNTITNLRNANGQIVENNRNIISECAHYYRKLYNNTNMNESGINKYLTHTLLVNDLSQVDSDVCEGLASTEECYAALLKMKKNKSPGLDGLPCEFYIQFWSDINELLVDCFNEAFREGRLSSSQNISILSLIFKKKDRLCLDNYRPISLANTDYKILAFTLANRLHQVMKKIISEDQTGYVKKRFIGHNIRLVEDIIDYFESENEKGGLITFLDFQKAFDSLNWKFMIQVLKKFKFGSQFVRWIETIYKTPVAVIKNNGWLSEKIQISRGIKQGCPLSALLFIIATEILALNLKQCNDFRGLGICNKRIKLIQYADDTILFLESEKDLESALSVIEEFSLYAGLKLNLAKTEGIRLGLLKNTNSKHKNINWTEDPVRCLGIYVGHNKQECQKLNWSNKVDDLQKLLDSWRSRDLTIYGKVTVIKVLAMSKLVYSAMNSAAPMDIEKDISKILYAFIWNKRDRIKRNVMISPIKHGGVNMLEVHCFFKSLKATWIDRLLKCDTQNWNCIGKYYLNCLGFENLLTKTSFREADEFPIVNSLPAFYKQVILAYNCCKEYINITNINMLLDEVLWGNTLIKTYSKANKKNNCLYFKTWIQQGIIYVRDLPFENGKVCLRVLQERIQNNPNLLFEATKLQMAFGPFKTILNGLNSIGNVTTEISILHSCDNSKLNYRAQVNKIAKMPLLKHMKFLNNIPLEMMVAAICERKIIHIYENKISEFNFKVIHNILSCGVLLSKWRRDINAICDICNQNENVFHLLWDCKIARFAWNKLNNSLDRIITKELVFLGHARYSEINNLTSQIAFSIYKYRLKSWETKTCRTISGMSNLLKNDIKLKVSIFETLGKYNYVALLQKVLTVL